MENLTKEQQRVEFDKHRKEIEKIILGCRGIQSRQVHWSEAVPMVAMYITKELEKFSHPTTASGSVASPKEDTERIFSGTPEEILDSLESTDDAYYHHSQIEPVIASLRKQLKERKDEYQTLYNSYSKHDERINQLLSELKEREESINDLIPIAERYLQYGKHSAISKNATAITISRAKALLDKQ